MSESSKRQKSILIICSNPIVLAKTKRELGGYFDVDIASNEDIAISILNKNIISAVIFCICDGLNNITESYPDVLCQTRTLLIPVIFLAERGCDEDEVMAFEIGAADYIMRRTGTVGALVNRIYLRIQAGENEQILLSNRHNIMQIEQGLHKKGFTEPRNEQAGSIDIPSEADTGGTNKSVSQDTSLQASEALLNGKSIIIADDIEINRDIVALILSGIEGLRLEFAEDGKQVVEIFSRDPDAYSLILMDVYMPVMSGLEATLMIRSMDIKKAKDIPIIAITADVEEKNIAEYYKAGMNSYIEKPMDYDNIVSLMVKYCS